MFDLTFIPLAVGAGIFFVLLIVFLDHLFGFSKGIGLGAFEILLEFSDGTYERRQRSLNNVTKSTVNGAEIAFKNISWWMRQPESNVDKATKERFAQLAASGNPIQELARLGLQLDVLVASSATRGNFLLFILHRTRDVRGNPITFPDANARVKKRRSLSLSEGLISKRLIRLISYRLPLKVKLEGLSKKAFRVYLGVPNEDGKVEETSRAIETFGELIANFVSAIPNYRVFGAENKTLQERVKGLRSELQRAQNAEKKAGGDSFEDSQSAEAIRETLGSGSKKTIGARTPVMLAIFPVLGAILFQYVLSTNPIFGVVVGVLIAVPFMGAR